MAGPLYVVSALYIDTSMDIGLQKFFRKKVEITSPKALSLKCLLQEDEKVYISTGNVDRKHRFSGLCGSI